MHVWTQIQSFIKGTYLSARKGELLTRESYLNLPEKRCKLEVSHRDRVYDMFEKYEAIREEKGLWDELDRTSFLIQQLMERFEERYEKMFDYVYVDEIQDLTQAEIGMLFLEAGLNTDAMFLAGDTAQAVSKGVDFRFEEVRSLVFDINDGKKKINKPETLIHNFRSHEGILRVAQVIMDKLVQVFPNSVNKIEADHGLTMGPRPGMIPANVETVADMVKANDGLRVLVRDDRLSDLKKIFPEDLFKRAVYGFIEAKGLEFSQVYLVGLEEGPEEQGGETGACLLFGVSSLVELGEEH